MSIAVLNQVYDEARRLSIAGSNLAVGDFRLKKLIEPLEKSAQKVPVFGTVAKAIDKLVTGNEKEAAQSLLDLSSLVLAIMHTQGETGVEGELKPIESKEMTLQTTQMSARLLKPLIEALTNKGGGRLEVIREAYEQGSFDDIRLVNPTIRALDDVYSEIGDFVEKIVYKYGPPILPEIRDKIDIKGRSGHVRRLKLYHQLDPQAARAVVLDAFENGSKEMKIAALGCLGDSPQDLPHLIEQAQSKLKDVRRVALARLGKFTDDASIGLLEKVLSSSDREMAVPSIQVNTSKKLWDVVLATTRKEFSELFTIKEKAKLDKALVRFQELLNCYAQRSDKDAKEQLSAMHDARESLRKLKGTTASGKDLLWEICKWMLLTGDASLQKRLIDDREQMQDESFAYSLTAALLRLPAKQVYDDYSGYFFKAQNKQKNKDSDVRSAVMALLPRQDDENLFCGHWGYGLNDFPEAIAKELRTKKWDPRWLTAAIETDDVECAIAMGDSKNANFKKYLLDRLGSAGKKKGMDHEYLLVLESIVELGYPEATQLVIDTLLKEAKAKSNYVTYWLLRMISKLPKTSVASIEKVLPDLPDRFVDEILPQLQTLKTK